jgi:hypothetical protein
VDVDLERLGVLPIEAGGVRLGQRQGFGRREGISKGLIVHLVANKLYQA